MNLRIPALCLTLIISTTTAPAPLAKERPFRPGFSWLEDANAIYQNEALLAIGARHIKKAPFPFGGIVGDLTDIAVIEARYAPGDNVEVFTRGALRNLLKVNQITSIPSHVTPPATVGETRSVTGDFSLFTKWRFYSDSLFNGGLLFGFTMPNSNVSSGVGLDGGAFHGRFLGSIDVSQISFAANLGIAIINDPTINTGQDDFFTFGAGISFAFNERLGFAGEFYGMDGPDDGAEDGLFDSLNVAFTVSYESPEFGVRASAIDYLADVSPDYGLRFSLFRRITLSKP